MVTLKEYRITNNCTVDEYRIAQLYSVATMSMKETGNGEGVEVIKNEPYEKDGEKGQYTFKKYSFASRIPGWIRACLPKDSLVMEEEAWNAYPHCLTVLTSPLTGSWFKVVTETQHLPDRGTTENALSLSAKDLGLREVVHLDVCDDSEIDKNALKPEVDPKIYHSEKTGRGPLVEKDWQKTCEPVMTCYKLLTVEFSVFGFQTAVESYIHKTMRAVFCLFHRQLFCETDEWHGMTIEELREMEEKTAANLKDKHGEETPK